MFASMVIPAVRLHAMSTGSMTSARGGFLDGEPGEITYPVPVFVIEHPLGLVVVDTGLHAELAATSARLRKLATMFQVHLAADGSDSVGPVLLGAGYDPDQVAQVILTHLHFDHTGGLAELPNARVVVQAREWAELHNERLLSLGAYNRDDVDLGHERLEIDGDHDLFEDGTVTCLMTDGHTAGHQSVRVRTETGVCVICGDCCYLRQTLTDEHLPPVSHDRHRHLQSIRRLAREQAQGATLLFGHDPQQWTEIVRDGVRPGVMDSRPS
jgi:glyoxylase-like metal-dependent hydrolase (beta-lactamase superfamily II)